jgi:hypothetical protein
MYLIVAAERAARPSRDGARREWKLPQFHDIIMESASSFAASLPGIVAIADAGAP